MCVCAFMCPVMWGSDSQFLFVLLPLYSSTSSPPSSFKCSPLIRRHRRRTKALLSLSLSLFVFLCPLISLCHQHLFPPPLLSSLHLVRLLSPLCFQPGSLTPSFCLCFHLFDRSSAPSVLTVIWQLYEFYTLAEYNYVQLISWNGS